MCFYFPWWPFRGWCNTVKDDESQRPDPSKKNTFEETCTRAVKVARELFNALDCFAEEAPGALQGPENGNPVQTAMSLVQVCEEWDDALYHANILVTHLGSLAVINTTKQEGKERDEMKEKIDRETEYFNVKHEDMLEKLNEIKAHGRALVSFCKRLVIDPKARERAFPHLNTALDNLSLLRLVKYWRLRRELTKQIDIVHPSFQRSLEQLVAERNNALRLYDRRLPPSGLLVTSLFEWAVRHIPPPGAEATTEPFLSLIRRKAGGREGDPWEPLDVVEVQEIMDTVYSGEAFITWGNDGWSKFADRHLDKWCHGFSVTAMGVVKEYFCEGPYRVADEETIKAAASYMRHWNEEHESKPFHWKHWDRDETGRVYKNGPLQSPLVLRTVALAHYQPLEHYLTTQDKPRPFGALILAAQAVEYALGAWESGTSVERYRISVPFDGTHCGNASTHQTPNQPDGMRSKSATGYIATVKNLNDKDWHEICAAIFDFLNREKLRKDKGKADRGEPYSPPQLGL